MAAPKSNNPNPNQGNGNRSQRNLSLVYIIITCVLIFLFFYTSAGGAVDEVDNTVFNKMIENQDVKSLEYVRKDNSVQIYLTDEALNKKEYEKAKKLNPDGPHYYIQIADYQVFNDNLRELKEELIESRLAADTTLTRADVKDDYEIPIKQNTTENWVRELIWVLPTLIIFGFFLYSMRAMRGGGGGGIFGIGKSKAQLFDAKSPTSVSFKDVAGMEGAKEEIEEIVDFLKNPKKYTVLGGKIPKGALLVGPPGTGKTLLAKAVAGEAHVPFFSMSGADFVEMFVGVGASRVRDLFKTAKEKAPCIIFIDEIDAIGRARGRNSLSGANDERESTLNQLLTEMDGFSTNAGVIILAATNRADVLDSALLRAGRFDRQIHVELPNLVERKGIFEVHVRNLKLGADVDLEFFAKQTPGFSGADIANVCNEAALVAARKSKSEIGKEDFLAAIDRIIGGLEKRGSLITPQEKKVIAYHESGHASVSWLLRYASPLVKVTIVPRGKSLGAAWYLPEERHITTYEQLFDEMTATLGGRAAEEVVFGKISTGALSDLEKASKQAYAMVVYYGLSKKIGNISYYDSTGQSEYSFSKPYSEKTAEDIDSEVHDMIEAAYARAKNILESNKDKLKQLAEILLEKEVIFAENLEEIFGKREFENEQPEVEQPKIEDKE
ncbi:MAG: ATP-dependent zinc metalloprotease FtsH [Bacteroidales bacterium]|nr:ATP-dependent zinc metalloprotease FtsH [Bacteroidales bacterium]MBQ7489221.1 ATP-dependent zinc metalloprotease FtsH [Bacteroidales bacterium]